MDINRIIKHVKDNGGVVFDTPFYINLFGIRNDKNVNKFNDTLIVYWYDDKKVIHTYSPSKGFTTDPGFKSLTSPVSSKGCAILKEGWYRRLWAKGLHKGKYSALVQANPCTVYRDNDKDKELDMNKSKTDTGMFGINMHRANENAVSINVEGWSAGCQVWASPGEFSYFMSLINKAFQKGQKYFSYFLTNNKLFDPNKPIETEKPKLPKMTSDGLSIIKKYEGSLNTNDLTKNFIEPIQKLITSKVTDNMFSAIVSFAHNVGLVNLKSSTLLKKVNAKPNDPSISDEFMKWVKVGGKTSQGLINRRKEESKLYFKK